MQVFTISFWYILSVGTLRKSLGKVNSFCWHKLVYSFFSISITSVWDYTLHLKGFIVFFRQSVLLNLLETDLSLNKNYSETSCDLCFCSWLCYLCTPGNRCTVLVIKSLGIYIAMSCVWCVGLDFQNSGRMFVTPVCALGGWVQRRCRTTWALISSCLIWEVISLMLALCVYCFLAELWAACWTW